MYTQKSDLPKPLALDSFFFGLSSRQGKPPQEEKQRALFRYRKKTIRSIRNAATAPRNATASDGTENIYDTYFILYTQNNKACKKTSAIGIILPKGSKHKNNQSWTNDVTLINLIISQSVFRIKQLQCLCHNLYKDITLFFSHMVLGSAYYTMMLAINNVRSLITITLLQTKISFQLHSSSKPAACRHQIILDMLKNCSYTERTSMDANVFIQRTNSCNTFQVISSD